MKAYSTVLFDIDNTLLDFDADEHNALCRLLGQLDIPVKEEYVKRYSEINAGLWREFEKALVTKEQLKERRFQRLFEEIGFQPAVPSLKVNAMYLENLGMGGATVENAETVLKALSEKGYKIHIVTNGIEHTQKKRLRTSGLDKYIDKCFVSEKIGIQKPFPAFFDYVFENIDEKNKSRVILIGDSLGSDIKGALDSHIDCIWFNPSGKNNDVCGKPSFEIASLMQILDIL